MFIISPLQVDDLSLRDNATHCMVTMAKQVAALEVDAETFRDVITQGLLVEVKAGIRHKKEVKSRGLEISDIKVIKAIHILCMFLIFHLLVKK